MTKIPNYWNKAKKYLSKKDRTMSNLIDKYKSPTETILTTRKDIFYSLCKSIIGQQISVAAANSVFKKFRLVCNNKINAKKVLKLKNSQLKKFLEKQETLVLVVIILIFHPMKELQRKYLILQKF